MVDPVKELRRIKIYDIQSPLQYLLRRLPQGLVGAFARTKAIARAGERETEHGVSTCSIVCCTSRSPTVGIPSWQIHLCGLGMSNAHTGCNR
jgi:hypothetical protein